VRQYHRVCILEWRCLPLRWGFFCGQVAFGDLHGVVNFGGVVVIGVVVETVQSEAETGEDEVYSQYDDLDEPEGNKEALAPHLDGRCHCGYLDG
jgi:hypothetical protein